MVDKRVNLIDILENGKFELNTLVLENLFLNIDCKISILTIINETEKADFHLIDYILRYLLNDGIIDWIYKTNHEEVQVSKLIQNKFKDENNHGIKVWPKPFYLSKYCGHGKNKEKIAVILMEVNLSEYIDEDVKQKLINFSKAISSDIVVNCRKEMKYSCILSIIKSFENEGHFNGLGKNLKFLVREWETSVNKNFKYGEKGILYN
jgi:hypothetical protein